jgi:hypothetical protein
VTPFACIDTAAAGERLVEAYSDDARAGNAHSGLGRVHALRSGRDEVAIRDDTPDALSISVLVSPHHDRVRTRRGHEMSYLEERRSR